MRSLYQVLKASKLNPVSAPDMITALWAKNISGGGSAPTEHEYTGAVPTTITANGEPLISWTIYGDMQQSGTPTPSSPIYPSEVGNKTANLLGYSNNSFNIKSVTLSIDSNGTVTFSGTADSNGGRLNFVTPNFTLPAGTYSYTTRGTDGRPSFILNRASDNTGLYTGNAGFTLTEDTVVNGGFNFTQGTDYTGMTAQVMLVSGSYAQSDIPNYEPFGYKIPILCGGTTTPVYLGQVQSERKIAKYEFTGQETDWKVASGRFYNDNAITDYMTNISNYAYCSHFEVIAQQTSASPVQDGNICFRNGLPRVYMRNDNCADVSAFTTWLQQQYSAGTPVTVWYVLATPTTGIVNEPLRKIGTYADSISNVTQIPTTAGSQTFDVDTELKPSEVYIKYKG